MVLKNSVKNVVLFVLPLTLRKRIAVWINGQGWLDPNRRYWWSLVLLRDFSERDVNEYHKFLWSHHLAYAAPYEVALKFGPDHIEQSRKYFFSELKSLLLRRSINPEKDIGSIFEVGCSLGYHLRFVETDLFPSATIIEGMDIDEYAVSSGSKYLKTLGSRVRIRVGDMEDMENMIGSDKYDIVICAGVLMYLNEISAEKVVADLLGHTRGVLAIAALALPEGDNATLPHSVPRESDGSFIHNIDSMVEKAGGTIVSRRWEGKRMMNGHSIYFVFSLPRDVT